MYWPNLLQIGTAMLMLCAITLPVGFAWLSITNANSIRVWYRNWMLWPVAILHGALILPFFLNLIGALTDIALTGFLRIVLWLALIAGLAVIGWIKARFAPAPEFDEPLFSTRWQQIFIVGIGLVSAILTIIPLSNFYVPVSNPIEGSAARTRIGIADWPKHIATGTALISDDHLPPANPYLSTDPVLHYYYFGYILPATVTNLTHNSLLFVNSLAAEAALLALTFPALLHFYARRIRITPGASLVAVFIVMLVSGLHIVFMISQGWRTGVLPGHIMNWGTPGRNVSPLIVWFIWTPQHVLGLIGAIIALLHIHLLQSSTSLFGRLILAVLIAVILAAIMGASTLVWFAVMLGLAFYTLLELSRRYVWGVRTIVWFMVVALGLSVILGVPFLKTVAGNQQIIQIHITTAAPGLEFGSIATTLFGPSTASDIVDFPLGSVVLFGMVFVTGIAGMSMLRTEREAGDIFRLWAIMLASGFLLMLTIRSQTGPHNDLARNTSGFMAVLLGLASAYWWMGRARSRLWTWKPARGMLAFLALLGLGTTLYEPYIRSFDFEYTPEERMVLFDWLNTRLERGAVYHINSPVMWYRFDPIEFVQRRTILLDTVYAALYTDANLFFSTAASLQQAYTVETAIEASRLFTSVNVNYVVIHQNGDFIAYTDPDFDLYFETVFENDDFLVFRVGKH